MFDLGKIGEFFKKNFKRKDLLIALGLIALYFLTRLINIDKFPIFCDEGIYIHWAKIAWHDATWRFVSLTDGRQPLQTWVTIPFLKLFPANALFAGRLFSVASGFVGFIGLTSFIYYLFGKKAALYGAIFYLFTPYFLFYDRMALADSAVNASFIWILFFSILLANSLRLDLALIFGLGGGLSLLTKSSVKLFLALAVFAPILFWEKNKRKFFKKLLNYIFLYFIVIGIAFAFYNVQRLSPFLHFVVEKNKTFILTYNEFFKNPLSVLPYNLKAVPIYSFWEMGFALGFLGLFGLLVMFKKDRKLFFYFLIWTIVPYLVVASFARVLFPRYIIFFASLMAVLTTYLFISLKNKRILIIFFCLYLISVAYFDYTILFDFKKIPFHPIDRGQYIEGSTAGWGMKEIVDYAREKSKEKPVIIMAEGDFGLAGDVLDVFLKPNDKVEVKGYWPLFKEDLIKNQSRLNEYQIYVVLAHYLEAPTDWPMTLIKRFDKPGNQSVTYLFQLK